jgi:UDP-GlcNAc:undecaprenyl-phosphate GlcNAc-1-phosphate transferase
MNMLNWSKGVDGQMPGIAAISAIIIGIASLRFTPLAHVNILVSQASFIVAGGAIGFLFYNFYPAKMFPGYSATILGFLIGVLSIMSSVKLASAILVMGVPAVDFMFTFTRRILSGKSPFKGDRQHLHHLLLNAGFSQRQIAFFYWAMSAILGGISLTLSSRGKLFAIILVVVVVGAAILTLKLFNKKGLSQEYD